VLFVTSDLDLTCPALEKPENGTVACTRSGLVVGDICTFRCDDGFDLIGSATRICLGNQTWSGTEATCVPSKFYLILHKAVVVVVTQT